MLQNSTYRCMTFASTLKERLVSMQREGQFMKNGYSLTTHSFGHNFRHE